MKRSGKLLDHITNWNNLCLATHKALLGKRHTTEAQEFVSGLDQNLTRLSRQLQTGRCELGRFHQFTIYDPKERLISAPCFAERVLHHAIMNVCEPIFDRGLIDDTFACRTGKGRIAAVDRAQQFAHRYPCFLKLDIRRYFDSISHERLLEMLANRFKEQRLLELFEQIIRCFCASPGRGLPIGSLTSQHFANFYLGAFDRFAKDHLHIRGYVRYMDDMVLWADEMRTLRQSLNEAESFLHDELQLELKGWPFLNRTAHGMDFLGSRIYRHHYELNQRSKIRFRRKLKRLEEEYESGEIGERELQCRTESMFAFTMAGRTRSWQFRSRVIDSLVVGGH